MRKATKTNNDTINNAYVQGYHSQNGHYIGGESYAFAGFEANKYFTSDRYKKTSVNADGQLVREDGKPLKAIGLEIETECHSIVDQQVLANVYDKIIFKLFPAGLFKMQNDSSLGGRTNAECITQLMTKEFIRNNYKNFKSMWNEYFPMFGITTQNDSCGMHVNLSLGLFGTSKKTQDDAIRKLYYLINKHYDLFTVAFNRTNGTRWCARCIDYTSAKTFDLEHMSASHGNALNYSHYHAGRIEIRLVGGQKNYACFRNTMETVFHLIDAVKVLSWNDLDDITKVFSGCNNYVYDRLSSNVYRRGFITQTQLDAIAPTVKQVQYL